VRVGDPADDFESGAPLTIALDPRLRPRQRRALLQRAQALSRALVNIDARLAETRALIAKIESGAVIGRSEIQKYRERLAERQSEKRETRAVQRVSCRQWRFDLGRQGREKNDQLTFKVAAAPICGCTRATPRRTRDRALKPGRGVDEQTLLDAAR